MARARTLRADATIRVTKKTRKEVTMGFFSKDIKTFDDLFVHTLRDIYYA